MFASMKKRKKSLSPAGHMIGCNNTGKRLALRRRLLKYLADRLGKSRNIPYRHTKSSHGTGDQLIHHR